MSSFQWYPWSVGKVAGKNRYTIKTVQLFSKNGQFCDFYSKPTTFKSKNQGKNYQNPQN